MRLPGPRDLVAFVSLVERSSEQLVALLPRTTELLGNAERLLRDGSALVDRIETTRLEAQALVERTEVTRDRADELVTGLEPTTRRAVALLAALEPTAERAVALLESMEPSLLKLQPTLERLAETTDPREVDALGAMLDQLPLLAAKVETDVIPVLNTLTTVSPDLHDLLDVSRELNLMLAKLPGMGRVKRRVDEQQEIEEGHRPPT
jgi:ABC-type transporter Mla subunit MlaD